MATNSDNAVNLLGYHLTFDAEFTTAADLAQFSFAFRNGDTNLYNNGDAQNYTPYDPSNPANPFSFANGALSITARPVPLYNLPYTSGMLQTANTFQQNQGYFEIRAQTTGAKGFWPAFWLLPNAYYPEIDILEQPNNAKNSEYWTHTTTPTDSSGGYTDTGVNLSAGYHSYGFLWTADTIQYTFDGKLISYAHTTPPALANLKMYMLANLAVGGPNSWSGAPVSGTIASFNIDYIRAYSKDPAAPAVAFQAISSPDGVDTRPMLALPPVSEPAPIGTGPDTLVLQISEDAYAGDAQFTISIDGVQQGGVQTALANHGAGQTQPFTVRGAFGTAAHTVTVNFLNNADNPQTGADRNLFVISGTINGKAIPGAVLNEYAAGPQSFAFSGGTPTPPPTPAPPPTQVTIGSGSDTFLVGISEDAWQGDARFTIKVDGAQQGGVQTASAPHSAGKPQVYAIKGTFGPGAHNVTVDFLNDAWGGTPQTDRNLYVDSLSYNGVAAPNAARMLATQGPVSLITASQAAARTDTLSVALTEDAYKGDAIAQITIDGKVLGTPTVTFLNNGGPAQVLTYTGSFGAGPHTVGVNFLNDDWGGAVGLDRNLYVKGVAFDGVMAPNSQAALYTSGLVNFNVPASTTILPTS